MDCKKNNKKIPTKNPTTNHMQWAFIGLKQKKYMKKQNLCYHCHKQGLKKFTLAQQIKQNLVKSEVFLMLWETSENAKQFKLVKVIFACLTIIKKEMLTTGMYLNEAE